MRKHLNFSISNESERHYCVNIQSFFQNCKKQTNTLEYTISLRLKKYSFNGYVVEITRSNVLLNNTKFHDVMDELLLVTSKMLNKLELEITPEGKIRRIKNLEKLHKKWVEIRMQVESGYTGEIVPRFLAPMEKTVMNEELFIKALWKDPFFRFYLSIYGEYYNGRMTGTYHVFDFPVGNSPIYQIEETNTLRMPETGEYGVSKKITIDKDELEKIRKNLPENQHGDSDLSVNMHCDYILSEKKLPLSLKSMQEAFVDGKLYKKVQMHAALLNL